jgi:prevent-host-death family protein
MRTMNATDFKARCLAILDEVAHTGETIVILKRGKAVARLVSPVHDDAEQPQSTLRGTVEIIGDILAPVLPADEWEAMAEEPP